MSDFVQLTGMQGPVVVRIDKIITILPALKIAPHNAAISLDGWGSECLMVRETLSEVLVAIAEARYTPTVAEREREG